MEAGSSVWLPRATVNQSTIVGPNWDIHILAYGVIMVIDTHAHIYSKDEKIYSPVDDPLRPPRGTGSLEHLWNDMKDIGVDRAVLIQTSSFYSWNNRFICDAATEARDWAVGVCTLDPDAPHSRDVLYALVSRSNIRGLRSVPGADGGYDCPGVRNLWAEATQLGIVVNSLVPLELADELASLLDVHPDLPVVLDHCLSLRVGNKYPATVDKVVELAQYPNLHAKLTFLPTGTSEEYPFQDMYESCMRIIDAYGPERCVWGSNFPTELWCPKVTYGGHLRLFEDHLGLNPVERDTILGGTAERLWFS